jgi:hypothetical protein
MNRTEAQEKKILLPKKNLNFFFSFFPKSIYLELKTIQRRSPIISKNFFF